MCSAEKKRPFFIWRDRNRIYKIPFGDVEKIEVRVRSSTGWGMFRGALVGAGVGGLIGIIIFIDKKSEEEEEDNALVELGRDTLSAFELVGYITIGGFIGIPVGAMFGAAFPGERWERISLTDSVSMRFEKNRTLSVRYSVRF